jgi:hypothetical protein
VDALGKVFGIDLLKRGSYQLACREEVLRFPNAYQISQNHTNRLLLEIHLHVLLERSPSLYPGLQPNLEFVQEQFEAGRRDWTHPDLSTRDI